MSADARDLFAEGLILPAVRLLAGDRVESETVELICTNSRSPDMRAGDLKAQIAGNVTGERRFLELIARYGLETFEAAIARFLGESERRMRAALRALPEGTYVAEDVLEDARGLPSIRIRAALTLRDGAVEIDYAGTSPQLALPINAVYGVTLSGIHFALRAATDPTIPMNEGCFRPVSVRIDAGTLLSPLRPAPVSGGNVETSTRNAGVILQALAQAAPERVNAPSGGTMSNVIAGGTRRDGSRWTFYETNGCGLGARPNADGLDGIQCDMTNTLNTPIEALERAFPLRVTRYEFVPGSGGDGRFRGGTGLVREFELTDGEATVVLLADRHTVHPPGLAGGAAAACGRHVLTRDGVRTTLPAKTTVLLREGDRLSVETPGGGGYGDPAERDPAARERDRRSGLA